MITQLTPKQREILDHLVSVFGEGHTSIRRTELKKASIDFTGLSAAPEWITRGPDLRTDRGCYTLAPLLALPVVEPTAKEKVVKPPKEKVVKPPKEKKVKEPKAPKVNKEKEPVDDTSVDTEVPFIPAVDSDETLFAELN